MSNIGFIYKMWSKTDPSLVYYGSTSQKHVCSRITGHRTDFKRWKQGKSHFVTSFRIIETGDWDYMTLEKVFFDDPFELKNRERFYIENHDCVNKYIPNQTKEEYYIENKDKRLEQMKQYNDTHKEEAKQYYIDNKDEITKYKKEYYIENKEEITKYKKQYYIENKQKNEIVQCECGCCVRADGLSKHRNSKKHKTIMSNLQNIIRIP